MMFKKISLVASLLFFLLGTNVFANSNIKSSSQQASEASSKQTAAAEVNKTANNQNSSSIYIVTGCITFVLLLGFGSYWLIYRRRHT